MKEKGPIAKDLVLAVERISEFDKIPGKDRKQVISSIAELVMQQDNLITFFGAVHAAVFLLEGKNKDGRAVGTQVMQHFNDAFQRQEVYSKHVFHPDLNSDATLEVALSALRSIPKELLDNSKQYDKKWPYVTYAYATGMNLCRELWEANKNGPIENCVFSGMGIGDVEKLTNVEQDQVDAYRGSVSRIRNIDARKTAKSAFPFDRKAYTLVINSLENTSFAGDTRFTHPMDIRWGGISIHEIQQLPKGSERDNEVLKYCANLPKGDVFWKEVTAAIFFSEVTEHNPDDRYEAIAKDFQTAFCEQLYKTIDNPKDPFMLLARKMLQNYDKLHIEKLGMAIANRITPRSYKSEDIAISFPTPATWDKEFASLHPVVRNMFAFTDIRPEKKSHPTPEVDILDKAIFSFMKILGKPNVDMFSSGSYPVKTREDRPDILGENGSTLRRLALQKFFEPEAIPLLSFVLPETHPLYAAGFRKQLVNKDENSPAILVEMVTDKNASFFVTITRNAEAINCSWLIFDHMHSLQAIVDHSIITLTANTYKESGTNYPQIAILQEYGIAMDNFVGDFDFEDAKKQVFDIEGIDPRVILRRRKLFKLLHTLYPEEATPPVHPGQEAIFELMQKAKRQGDDV